MAVPTKFALHDIWMYTHLVMYISRPISHMYRKMSVCIYPYMYVFRQISIYVCMYIHITCMLTCVCMYVCISV